MSLEGFADIMLLDSGIVDMAISQGVFEQLAFGFGAVLSKGSYVVPAYYGNGDGALNVELQARQA